jgi:serine/threonine protein kinase
VPAVTSPYAQLNALIDTVLDDRYRIEAMIGTGGMGAIYRARREGLERPVALKVLHPAVSSDPTTAKRFEREAYSVSKLDHPNVVRVSDYGTTKDGMTYFAMELVEGTQLTSHLGEPMAPARAADLISQVLEGLEHAHEHKIVHRDLKPDNVLVRKDASGKERVKLVDFGIAKVLEDRQTQERLTQTGFVYGTPHYMSPEQAMGSKVDHRADLYAVGLILYEMLVGHRAFRAMDPASMLRKQVTQPHDPLPADVPKRLAHVVDRLLEKSPDDRFQSAREVLDAIAATRKRLEGVPAAKLPAGGDDTATRADPVAATVANASADAPVDAAASTAGRPRGRSDSAPTAVASRSSASVHPSGEVPGPSSLLPWTIAGIAVLGLGAAVGYMLMEDDATQVAAAPAEAETGAEESTDETGTAAAEEDTGRVTMLIETNVPAKILDETDGGIFGESGSPFELEKSDDPVVLVLRADGYQDHRMEIRPSRSKTFEKIELKKRPRSVIDLRDPWKRDKAPMKKSAGDGVKDPDDSERTPAPEEDEAAPAPSAPEQADPKPNAGAKGPDGNGPPGRQKKKKSGDGESPDLSDPFKPGPK